MALKNRLGKIVDLESFNHFLGYQFFKKPLMVDNAETVFALKMLSFGSNIRCIRSQNLRI